MGRGETVHFYLEDGLRQSAEQGAHNFINLLIGVLRNAGLRTVFAGPGAQPGNGYSLSHMINPPNDRGLVFRRVYHYPFWQIDAVAQRWQWDVARAHFDPDQEAPDAQRFYRFWQKRLFEDGPQNASRDGFVYVPLQGHLMRERLFQSCTPLEMVESCLAHAPDHRIVATLHPKETYGRKELSRLETMAARHPRLTLDTGNAGKYLRGCDFVVTQNSGTAFSGFFFGKPALLFGQIDFHHICAKADMDDLACGFDAVSRISPDFATYVWWFWQQQSINAGRSDAADRIAARLARFGWPVPAP